MFVVSGKIAESPAHGDLERWRGVRAIDVVFNFSGGLLDLRGFPGHHRPAGSVDALKPRAVLQRLSGDPDDQEPRSETMYEQMALGEEPAHAAVDE
jgi:hypothetical protein